MAGWVRAAAAALGVAAAAVAMVPGGALAQTDTQVITAKDPATWLPIYEGLGYKPKLDAVDGDPFIMLEMLGYKVRVFFYGCTAQKDCKSVQYYTAFAPKTKLTHQQLGEFGRDWRFGKVYLDRDGDPAIEWDVMVADGITIGSLREGARMFEGALDEFDEIVFPPEKK